MTTPSPRRPRRPMPIGYLAHRVPAATSLSWMKRMVIFLGLDVLIAIAVTMFILLRVFADGISVPAPWQAAQGARQIARGTVTRTNLTSGRPSLTIRSTRNRLSTFVISSGHMLVTQDGLNLAVASVRPGDTLIAHSNGRLEDTSQRSSHLSGVVAIEPDADEGPMIVQVGQSYDVVVDIVSGTRINGTVANKAARTTLSDADQVDLTGILDSALGEMTQTETITRNGPGRAAPASSPPDLSGQSSSG